MVARTASLRLQLIEAVSGPAKAATAAMRNLEKSMAQLGKAGVPGAQSLVRQMDWLKQKSEAVFRFNKERRELAGLYKDFRDARTNVARISETIAVAAREPKKYAAALRVLKQDLSTANAQLRSSSSAFSSQRSAVKSAEQALKLYSINGAKAAASAQKGLRDQMAQTIRKMRELERSSRKAATPPPPPKLPPTPRSSPSSSGGGRRGGGASAADGGAVIGGSYVAGKTRDAAQAGFFYAVDFSEAADYQQALGGFSESERGQLNQQAQKIGGETRFSNADVVRAQTQILQAGIRAPQAIMNLTRQVTDYALAMGVTLEEGAETIRGSALSKRVDLNDAAAVKRFVDFMVWMAKNSGMSDEDVRQFMKYGGAATTGAGLPDPYSAAIGMILRRSGVRGDEAGVFARSASSKLVAPTNKGRSALYSMGINYDDFTKMPDAFNTKGIGIMLKNEFGKALTEEMRKQIDDAMDDEVTDPETGETRSVASDRGEFVTKLSEILSPLFEGKNGKMAAKDANALAKKLGDYHKMSVESIDVVGLFQAIMSSSPTLAQLNAFFTDRQGGRANMIAQQWGLFEEFRRKMEKPPEGEANRIGVEANKGLYGDWTRLTGTVETALTKAAQDWEFAIRPAIQQTDAFISALTEAPPAVRRLVEAFAAAAGIFAGYAAIRGGVGLLTGAAGAAAGGAATGAGAAAGGAAGLAAGSVGKKVLPKLVRGAGAVGVGMLSLDALREADPKGNLWGLTDPVDDWFKRNLGVNPSNLAWRSPGSYNSEVGAEKSKAVDAEMKKLDEAVASWPEKAKEAMNDFGAAIQEGGPDAEAKAAEIAKRIESELAVTGHPDVDTARLEKALALARQVAGAVKAIGSGGGGTGYVSPPNDNKWGGPRASGGPVAGGKTYLVGEEGPELFSPGRSGAITPAGATSQIMGASRGPAVAGGVTVQVTNNITINGGAGQGEAMRLAAILDRQLRRSAQTAFCSTRYGED